VRTPATLVALAVAASTALGPVPAARAPEGPATSGLASGYTVLQMNLCLSGAAACFGRTAYPSVVDEAAAQVVEQDAEAVTLNEACSGDVAELARRTGYRMRFAAVLSEGAPVPCVRPGGRGVFGLAVLTEARVSAARDRAFEVHAGAEERRWLCVTTERRTTVCSAHLGTRDSAVARAFNDAECRELRTVLERYDGAGPTVFGGDVNRREPCAPVTMWTRDDTAAGQLPGIQHVYGSTSLGAPAARVATATYTDHDFLAASMPAPTVPAPAAPG
jgi:endonuclease/exonuclease/phosphatase family metal-dependent hydrolase